MQESGVMTIVIGVSAARGSTGGVLTIWNKDSFTIDNQFVRQNFVVVAGTWTKNGLFCYLSNVYAPCGARDKKELWKKLINIKQNTIPTTWCVAGYFNAVRNRGERRGMSEDYSFRERNEFEQFILDMELID